MLFHKKHLLSALILCSASSLFAPKEPAKDFQQTASQIATTTLEHAKYALLAAIQSFDSLLYPAICLYTGRAVYNNYLSSHLADAPTRIVEIEKILPGGDTARHLTTYFGVGAALFMGFNALTNAESVHDFMEINMPNTANLVSYLKTQFTHPPKAAQPSQEHQIICRK